MWVYYRGPLSTVYNDEGTSTLGSLKILVFLKDVMDSDTMKLVRMQH